MAYFDVSFSGVRDIVGMQSSMKRAGRKTAKDVREILGLTSDIKPQSGGLKKKKKETAANNGTELQINQPLSRNGINRTYEAQNSKALS